MILCPVFPSLCCHRLSQMSRIVQRGRRVFTQVYVGFFAARRSLFHSSRATKHREVKYLLFSLKQDALGMKIIFISSNIDSYNGIICACRSLHSVLKTDSSHFIKLKFILLLILPTLSAIKCRLITPRSDHVNLPKD